MNFDLGDVLARAAKITWKHKVLWLIGIVFGFLVSTMFPLMFSPLLFPFLAFQRTRIDTRFITGVFVGFAVLFLLYFLALYVGSVFTQTSLTLGTLDLERMEEIQLSAIDLLKRSRPFFWRVLGLMVLFALGMGLVNLLIQVLFIIVSILTAGIGSFCLIPLMFLMYPFLFGGMVWMEQAMNGVIIDNMKVVEAAKQGWNLIRYNLLPMILIALVVYFGVGLISGVLILPMMAPLLLVQFSFIQHQANWPIVLAAVLWLVAFSPLFAILTGFSMIFTKSTWVLTYLRLTRSPKLQPLPGLAEATL